MYDIMEKKRPNIELRSREVQELMGAVPSGIIRYGIGVILLLLIGFVIASHFITYSEERMLTLTLQSNVETLPVTAAMDGRVVRSNGVEGEKVERGDTLLVLDSSDKRTFLLAPAPGILHYRTFCFEGEKVCKGQPLVEIFQVPGNGRNVFALAVWPETEASESIPQTLVAAWEKQSLRFVLDSTMKDDTTDAVRLLYVSDKQMQVPHTVQISAECEGVSVSLFEKIFGQHFFSNPLSH